jgi:iron complex transport system permease protein
MLLVLLIALSIGTSNISIFDVLNFFYGNANDNTILIVKYIRLPRVITSCITGAGLAVSGCILQAMLQNNLADPFTLGISGGAAFGATIALILKLSTVIFVPICSFLGALFSAIIVYLISFRFQRIEFDNNIMILSGIVVNYVFTSIVMLILILTKTNNFQSAYMWLMGSFSIFEDTIIYIASIIIIVGIIILSMSGNIINIITLGSDKAKTLGLDFNKKIKFFFIISSLITSSTVAISGVIGFVGLIIPHIVRKIISSNNLILIPMSAFIGSIFLLICDSLSRMFVVISLPIGIITNIIGGLFFIYLLVEEY